MNDLRIEIVTSANSEHVEIARSLFREYETWLGLDLCFQGFEAELSSLPGKYSEPGGRLFLAYCDEVVAGCGALRALDSETGEMKRIYVRPDFRGAGLGIRLIDKVIDAARDIGYLKLRLDTFPPKMEKAVSLYRSLGFREIEPYYPNPNSETLFMELDLSNGKLS